MQTNTMMKRKNHTTVILTITTTAILVGFYFYFVTGVFGFWEWLDIPPKEVVLRIQAKWGSSTWLPEDKKRVFTHEPFYSKTFTSEPNYRCLPSNQKPDQLTIIKSHRVGYICDNELWITEFTAGEAPSLYGPFGI